MGSHLLPGCQIIQQISSDELYSTSLLFFFFFFFSLEACLSVQTNRKKNHHLNSNPCNSALPLFLRTKCSVLKPHAKVFVESQHGGVEGPSQPPSPPLP